MSSPLHQSLAQSIAEQIAQVTGAAFSSRDSALYWWGLYQSGGGDRRSAAHVFCQNQPGRPAVDV